MFYRMIFWLVIWNWETAAQYSYQIEDIPIEHYIHDDIQQDDIDVELMPRSPRFLPLDKNNDSDEEDEEKQHIKYYFDSSKKENKQSRSKRDTNSKKLMKQIGKPLELLVIETQNITENKNASQHINERAINDFIRFKRSSDQTVAKFVQKDSQRETRGATKEQWVKQAFPVQREDNNYEDNLQLSSEGVRAPRVHFVTNGMQERDPLEYRFNREARSGAVNKYSPSDLSADMDNYQPRFARNYSPRDGRYTNTYDRYPRDYYRRQDYSEKPYNPDYNAGAFKRRRVIYYATLPETPRNSRDDNPRRNYDRYYSRDGYDDRSFYPEQYDNYRKRYREAPRYDDNRERDVMFPIKVSTDVKVRDIKKNPERRIYSDVDRTSYQQE